MVVQQHKLLKGVLRWAFAPLLLASACADAPLASVEKATVETHVGDWREEIIYQLMTDRFANGDKRNDHRVEPSSLARYQGGDYQGIIDRLDYLQELGVTALWISPIVLNVDSDAGFDAYHGYWQQNLNRLNPHFGDLATLRKLVKEAHAHDIKIILDIVTNHLGQVFYYDINNNGQPDEWLAGSGQPGMPGESGSVQNGPLSRVTEYDPDYDPRGIQGFTSLGLSGLAPIRFFDMPAIWRVLPEPKIFQTPEAYNRRGRVTNWDCQSSLVPGNDVPICEQVVLGDFPGGLKDINTTNPKVREALVDAFTHWVLETDLDGFRIDTLKHVEHDFWREFAANVRTRLAKAGKTNFLMFGEAFVGPSPVDDELEGSYTREGMLDSVFYFPQHHLVFNGVFRRQFPMGDREREQGLQGTKVIETLLKWRGEHYGDIPQPGGVGVAPQNLLVNFMDNHDRPRFRFQDDADNRAICADLEPSNCDQALEAALTYLLTEEGIPCIYYGTEQDFDGGNDPGNREVLWNSGYRTDGRTFKYIQKLTKLRKASAALKRGETKIRWTTEHVGSEQDAGMLAFERVTDDDYALVVINSSPTNTSETSTDLSADGSTMTVSVAPGTELVDLLGNVKEPFVVGAGGELKVRLDPYGAVVLAAKR